MPKRTQPPGAKTAAAPPRPTIQGRAWRLLIEISRDLFPLLDQEFRANTGLDLQRYDIMLHVSESPGGCRMTDLAGAIVTSKSGLTSIIDRMEADGLLERRPDPDDRRVTRLRLTKLGEERFAQASRHHRSVVRRIFTSRVSDSEAHMVVDVLQRLREDVSRAMAG